MGSHSHHMSHNLEKPSKHKDDIMQCTNNRDTGSRLLVLGVLVLGLMLPFGDGVTAQPLLLPKPPLKIAYAPPDLQVTVIAPPQMYQGDVDVVQIDVTNPLTRLRPQQTSPLAGSAAKGVTVEVLFTGFEALDVQGDSGFQCVLSGDVPATGFWCTGGIIAPGGTATISVSVRQNYGNCSRYCSPAYTDVRLDPSNTIAERSETNNRGLAVTDIICIN